MTLLRILLATLALSATLGARADGPPLLPAFTSQADEHWFNSPPLQIEDLRGQVLLIDVWTFGCWNCYRSFPWLKALEARLADRPFKVVGIHSPEFEHERDPARVLAKIEEFGLHHPVMLDNDFRYWRALGNRYWPAYYLVDKQGRIRHLFVGETHEDDLQARLIEERIQALLDE